MTEEKISGGPIELKNGWALIPFCGKKAHYWQEQKHDIPIIHKGERVSFYESKCGLEGHSYKGVQPLAIGTFDKCKRCAKLSGT